MNTKLMKTKFLNGLVASVTRHTEGQEIEIKRGYFIIKSISTKAGVREPDDYWDFTFEKLRQSTSNAHYYRLINYKGDSYGVVKFNYIQNQVFRFLQNVHFFQRKDDIQWLLTILLTIIATVLLFMDVFHTCT